MGQGTTDGEGGFELFERFLEEWSRRDFLRRVGGAAAFTGFMAGGVAFLESCLGQTSQLALVPTKGGHLVEGSASEPRHLLSVLASDVYSITVISLCFDGLLSYGAGTGDLVPMIAKEVPKPSEDGLTFTFKLRPDVKWSDGQPLTADDVVFTYKLMFDPAYAVVNSPRRGNLSQYLQSITAPDQYTVVMTLKKTNAPFLSNHGWYGILPKHVLGGLEAAAINTADFDKAPGVVSGAFKFVKWDKGQQIVLARNEGYYRGAPHLDQYVYKIIPDTVKAANLLQTGEIDVGLVDWSVVDSLQHARGLNLKLFDGPSFVYFGYQYDPAKPAYKIFGDKQVRQGLAYALNRQKMIQNAYFGNAQVANGFEPLTSWAHSGNVTPNFGYDVKKAERLLDEAGWTKNPSTGMREKGGAPLKFTLMTNSGYPDRASLVTIMQDQWKQVGVDVTPDTSRSLPQLGGLLQNARDFDMFLIGLSSDSPDGDQADTWSSAAARPGGLNAMPYRNPQVDDLFDQAASTYDRSKRKALYEQIQDIFNDDCVAVILAYPKRPWGILNRVQGFNVSPYNEYRRPWIKDVFVSDGK